LLNTAVLFFHPNGNRLKQYSSFFHQKAVTLCADALSPAAAPAEPGHIRQGKLVKGGPHIQRTEEATALDTLEEHLGRIHAVLLSLARSIDLAIIDAESPFHPVAVLILLGRHSAGTGDTWE
jgi:hypothetical protein